MDNLCAANSVFAQNTVFIYPEIMYLLCCWKHKSGRCSGSSVAVPDQLGFGTLLSRSRHRWGARPGDASVGGRAVHLISGMLTVGFACCVISTSLPSVAVCKLLGAAGQITDFPLRFLIFNSLVGVEGIKFHLFSFFVKTLESCRLLPWLIDGF